MIYVPQFRYPTPPGFQDIDFDHYYDALPSSGPYYLPQLEPAAGVNTNPILNIPLRLDPDAPFIWRGIKVENGIRNFGMRLRDAYGNFLCPDADYIPVWLFAYPPAEASGLGMGPNCVIDPEMECPPNSVIYLDIYSFDTTPWASGGPSRVWLTGVKRYADDGGCGDGVICE